MSNHLLRIFTVIIVYNILSSTVTARRKEFDHFIPSEYNEQQSSEKLTAMTEIRIALIQLNIFEISTKSQDILTEIHFTVVWTDNRLNHEDIINDVVILPKHVATSLWHPRLHFPDCKQCEKFLINPNVDEFAYIKQHRQIRVPVRQTQRFICYFELANYPFDAQVCYLRFQLYALNWDNLSLKPYKGVHDELLKSVAMPPEFELINVTTTEYKTERLNLTTVGLSYNISIQRISVRHIFVTFAPSFLMVLISWISFWFEPGVPAPRVALGLTVLLTMITHFNTAQKDLPVVASMTALDVWRLYCVISVFWSLVEMALAYHIQSTSIPTLVATENVNQPTKVKKWLASTPTAKKLDHACRVIFPLAFFIFNLIFWCYYCV